MPSPSDIQPCLRVEGLTKRYGALAANDGISFAVAAGELHCLLGENGAGKSTLIGCIFGSNRPDEGRIFFEGREMHLRSPADAARLGIAVVHQHFVLIPRFTVFENVTLGAWAGGLKLKPAQAEQRLMGICADLALNLDIHAKVETLSVGERQWVELLKALYLDTKLLLLDEPTAVLTPQESERLFAMIQLLTGRGIAVVLISHKFDEVMQTDRVTILRRGRVVTTLDVGATSKEELATLMVGRSVNFGIARTARAISPAPVLDVQNLILDARAAEGNQPKLSFQVRRGEILGLAGVSGNGQDELFEILSGGRQPSGGTVLVDGIATKGLAPPPVARLGVGYVPSDRYRDGLVGAFSIADNLLLGQQHEPSFSRRGFLNRARAREFARDCVARFDVSTSSLDLSADRLSGGNAQKLVLAREFERATKCLLCHQPTRGLDVAIIAFVHELLLAKQGEGCAILLASEELDELINLSDRIMVMFRGEIMGIVDAQTADRETLGLMMAGQRMQ
jgi:general nucleoside transport system ATP-binding protein